MTAGGELTVRVANRGETGGSTLLLEISDTGRGISDGVLDNIFSPFVTTKPRGGVADAHRATLNARNDVGRSGCTFAIEFPDRRPSKIHV